MGHFPVSSSVDTPGKFLQCVSSGTSSIVSGKEEDVPDSEEERVFALALDIERLRTKTELKY